MYSDERIVGGFLVFGSCLVFVLAVWLPVWTADHRDRRNARRLNGVMRRRYAERGIR